jgi:hypothetical protein
MNARPGLQLRLFGAVPLGRVGILGRRRRFLHSHALFVAGRRPPAALILRQLTHLGALLAAGHLFTLAIAHRRLGTRDQQGSLVGQGPGCGRSDENYDSDCLAKFLCV